MSTTKCILTGLEVVYSYSDNTYYYDINIANKKVTVFICHNCESEIRKVNVPFHIINGLIINDILPKRVYLIAEDHKNDVIPPVDSETIILSDYLKTGNFPKTPAEKMNHLFLNLFRMQKVDGELVK